MTVIHLDMKQVNKAVREHLAARGEKWCHVCQWPLSFEAFYRNKRTPDGLSGHCRQCMKASRARYYAENTEKVLARQARYRSENAEKAKARLARYYTENKERLKANRVRYYAENTERQREQAARWQAENPERVAAISANRRAQKLNATPPWLTDEHREAIEHHYRLAKLLNRLFCTPGAWHVDHIAPLINGDISGLHVPWNLRVITAKENLSKHNNLIPKLLEGGLTK